MGKIIYLMGKSSSGKDTVYRKILQSKKFNLSKMVPYTTRPIREGEQEGVEYHFTDVETLEKLKTEKKHRRSGALIAFVLPYISVLPGRED